MLLSGSTDTWAAEGRVLAALISVMAFALIALLAAAAVSRLLGITGANVVTRVLGVVLAALATQFVIDGLRESFGLG
jgi:multiple antibiotic resistance protein